MRAHPVSSIVGAAAVVASFALAPDRAGATPAGTTVAGFRLWLDPLTLGLLETDVDTDSAKFEEYRDLGSGMHFPELGIFGESADGERTLAIRARNIGREDARYGLDYESLKPEFPKLVYCSITGFGQTGPYAAQAGYDILIQAMGGIMSITGEAGGPPMKVGVAIVDVMCGM